MPDLCFPEVILVLALPARRITWVVYLQPKRPAVSIQEDRLQACYPAATVFVSPVFAEKFWYVLHMILVVCDNVLNDRFDSSIMLLCYYPFM